MNQKTLFILQGNSIFDNGMAMQTIRVQIKKGGPTTAYCYEGITEKEAEILREEVLTDEITQQSTLQSPTGSIVRIGYKPGVTNPEEDTFKKVAQLTGMSPVAVATYTEYTKKDVVPAVSQVEEIVHVIPKTIITKQISAAVEKIPITMLSDSELMSLSATRSLFLNSDEMHAIVAYFKKLRREPTDVELETLAQTWSEHNGHKTFKATLVDEKGIEKRSLFSRIKETAKKYFDRVGVVTAFADNAGGIEFYDGWAIIGKWETHNSPVAIEPFGGAATKNGGVFRDIAGTGKGGINLVAFMINNIADPNTRPGDVPPGCLHPKTILLENSRGERDYGNKMGIPTHGISLHVDPGFVAKPTSMGGVIGMIPQRFCKKGTPRAGDLVVTIGGKTGRDGIHGATFSSGEMTGETKTIHATAVQLGNAIEEKRMFDALTICRDTGLVRAITDCGGGGYSSAIGEMGESVGVEVNLDAVPLKYQGLSPWEIWLSESQERMVAAVDPKHWKEFAHICESFETPATCVGRFTGDHNLTIKQKNAIVGKFSMDFLHHGLPARRLPMVKKNNIEHHQIPAYQGSLENAWKKVLDHWSVCSVESMIRQYDQSVQGRTVLFPFTGVFEDAPNDASVIASLYGKRYGVVTAGGSNPILNRIDPYWGSIWAVAKAMSNFVAVGGNPSSAALIDNFVAPYPDAETLGDLDRMVDALVDMMNVLKIPIVSGKDSLSGTYRYADGNMLKIPPVLHVTVFGKIIDIRKTITSDIKHVGLTLVLVGAMDVNALGGSVYIQTKGKQQNRIPRVDPQYFLKTLRAVHKGISSGVILSCHDIAEGGLAATISEMCFGGDCGATIDIEDVGAQRPDFALFNETAGCFLIEVKNKNVAQKLFHTVPYVILGKSTKDKKISVFKGRKKLETLDLYELKKAWQKPMKEIYP